MRAAVAFLLNFHVALYFATGHPAYYQNPNPLLQRRIGQFAFDVNSMYRSRRDEVPAGAHVINLEEECMLVTSDAGKYYYKSTGETDQVCGIYMMAPPNKLIEVIVTNMDVPCDDNGLLIFIDGWELNGQFFPSPRDHPIPNEDDRYAEFCGKDNEKRVYLSNQNAAMLQYRVPARRKGFSVTIRHLNNPQPCNILVSDIDGIYTLRNHQKAMNCSLSAIYPASIRIESIDIGVVGVHTHNEDESSDTGTITMCKTRHLPEYLQIGGSKGLDNVNMESAEDICGKDSLPAKDLVSIFCDVSTVRLVSSGKFDNSVTLSVKSFDLESDPTITCME